MAVAWLITLPSAALVGALCWGLAHLIGGLPGVVVVFAVLCALSLLMYVRSRRQPIDASNVTAEWDGKLAPAQTPAPAPAPEDVPAAPTTPTEGRP
jgi:PiT family inorganic phosphate transporter